MERKEEDEEEIVCLDESFFIDDNYELTTFTFGSQVIQLFCLHSASTDFDLTGQLVWPGAMLLNDYLSKNAKMLEGCSIIELGSGVGITGILCSRFCRDFVMTDHNDEVLKILKKNIELHASPENPNCCAGLVAEKLEWGNSEQINQILHKYSGGFDLILGADISKRCAHKRGICWGWNSQKSRSKSVSLAGWNTTKVNPICMSIALFPRLEDLSLFSVASGFQQSSVPLLFHTVKQLLQIRGERQCKFILAYVSRAKVMDLLVVSEATRQGMQITEIAGSRCVVGNLDGVIFEVTHQ